MKVMTNSMLILHKIRFQFLSILLIVLFVVVPYFDYSFLSDVVLSIVFFVALAAISEKRSLMFFTFGVGVAAMACAWAALWNVSIQLEIAANVFEIIFALIISYALLTHVFTAKIITRETVAGAICVYLFIGLLWSNIYSLHDIAQPDSFSQRANVDELVYKNPHLRAAQFTYFSFVTLSTLGYGDITPQTRPARALAAMEAILGQLYLAVLIARLVGQQVSTRENES